MPAPTAAVPRPRAKQDVAYGRRGKGDSFGAFPPATGEAFTVPDQGRTIANWVDFLEQVEGGRRRGGAGLQHPFVWGCRQRRRASRRTGIAHLPLAA